MKMITAAVGIVLVRTWRTFAYVDGQLASLRRMQHFGILQVPSKILRLWEVYDGNRWSI